jgi:hypothetical protein
MIRFKIGTQQALPRLIGQASVSGLSVNFSRVPQAGPPAHVSINVRRMVENVAPDAVFFSFDIDGFDVKGPIPPQAYDLRYHELYYLVDWDDPVATHNAPEHIPDEWRDANVGDGPTPAHVYQKPGNYNPSVTVVDRSGNWATATVADPIIVQDPETLYPAAQTICVVNDGDFSGVPDGAQLAESFSNGWTLYRNLPEGTHGRFC